MKFFMLSFTMLMAALTINVTTASAQWSYQTNPLPGTGDPTMVGKVQFVSSTEGWISAVGGNLLHTTNAGATWNVVKCTNDSVFSFSDPAVNMQFINASTGWVLKTLSTNSTVNFSNAQGAVVYYTTNGGSTWSKSIIASGAGLIGVQLQFVDANNGFATVFNPTSNSGYLYKTTNGGSSWATVGSSFTGTDEVQLFYFINATTGWTLLINDSPAEFKIKQTTDGGNTWTTQYNDATSHGIYTNTSCGAIQFVDANNGWAVGPNSRIVKTTDGGTTWTPVTPSLTSGLNTYQKCMFMYDANHIWIGEDVPSSTTGQTTSHFLMHTLDGGTTWVQDNISLSSSAFSLFFWDTNTGWLTGDYTYSNGVAGKGVIASYFVTPPKTVNVTAGGLYGALTSTELNTVTNLTITGTIDARDFVTMRDNMPALAIVDLSGANIVGYSGTGGTYPANVIYPANEIPQYAFYNNNTSTAKTTLTSIALPSSCVSVGASAFLRCTGLSGTLSLSSSISNIGDNAFQNCSSLTGTLILPSSLNSMGGGVFQNCTGLTGSLVIPSSLTSLNSWDFAYCTGITSVTIPSSVTTIYDNVFNGCSGLTSIYANKSTPVDLSSSLNVFSGVNYSTCTLYVPTGSKTLYQAANQWQNFTNIVEHTVTATTNITESKVKVSVQNHQAVITGMNGGEEVTLYTVHGLTLAHQTAKAESLILGLPSQGVYVVRVGDKSFKVVNN
ncbi:MAG: leucine-rich repeat protein [Microbacter sp.]